MVAMSLLAIVLMSLARMSMIVSTRGRTNAIAAKRNFVLIQEANKFGAMPYATLAAFSNGSTTVTAGDFSYTRRLEITCSPTSCPTGTRLAVKIAIVPTDYTTMVDSVWVYRTLPAQSPLCVGC